jgi:mitosis inhibitor protein kinase SWE1
VKQLEAHHTPSYVHISNSHLNPQPRHTYLNTTTTAPAFGGGGTKRKSTPLGGSGDTNFSTPPQQRFMTPLGISSAQNAGDSASGNIVFNRLALLPAPRFTVRTPETKGETEVQVHLKKHTESMTRLRIGDLDGEGSEALFSRPSRTVDSNSAKTKAHMKGKGRPKSSLGFAWYGK